jgi:O-antigen/teichoic acid export membrane protein
VVGSNLSGGVRAVAKLLQMSYLSRSYHAPPPVVPQARELGTQIAQTMGIRRCGNPVPDAENRDNILINSYKNKEDRPLTDSVPTAFEDLPPTPPMPRPRRRVLLNVLFALFTRAQGALFTYVTTFLLLRALDVEGYGFYTVLYIGTINTLLLVGRLGIPNLLLRFIPEYFSAGRWRLIAKLFRGSNLIQMGVSLLLLVVAYVLAPQLCVWLNYPHRELLLRVFAIGAFSYILSENYRVLLESLFQQDAVFWRNLSYNILRLGGILIATRQANPLLAVLVVEALMATVSVGLYAIAYGRVVRPKVAADPHPQSPPEWKRYRRYTSISYLNELGVMLITSTTDMFLVSGFLGGIETGLYGLASRILISINQILPSNFLASVTSPLFFSEYGADEQKDKAGFGFTLLLKIGMIITLPIGLWLAVMARPLIVELFNPRYGDAAPVLAMMGLFMVADAVRGPLGLLLQNAERNDLLLYSKITGVVKVGVGVFWLSHGGGAVAMVVTTSVGIIANDVLMYYWIVTKLHTHTDLWGLLKILINGTVTLALFYPLAPYFTGVIGVLASVPAFAVLYLGISLLNKSFSREERAFINSHIPYPVWKF